jgi:hypothetical protein
MASSFVEWDGLTKMILDMDQNVPRNASREMAGMTRDLGDDMLQLYRDNLEGSEPSTAANPLPVGMRSGDLYAGATLSVTNQYAFSLYNDTPWAGFIENGTVKMAPRLPLANTVETVEQYMDVTLDEVMVGIIE